MAVLTSESGIDTTTILVDQAGTNKTYTFAHLAAWVLGKTGTVYAPITGSANYLSPTGTGAGLTAVDAITLQTHAASYFQTHDTDLDTWAGISPSANFQTLATQNFAQIADSLSLTIGTDTQAYDYELDTLSLGITGLVKGFGDTGGYAAASPGSDYLTPTGNGSGLTAVNAATLETHASSYFSVAAGSTSIDTVGTITTGTWNATALAISKLNIQGGTRETTVNNADLIVIYDTSGTANRTMTRSSFLAGITGGAGAFVDLTDISVNANTSGFVIWEGTTGRAVKYGSGGTEYVKSDGTYGTPSGAGDMAVAAYPHIVAIEALAVTDSNIIVGNGSTWVAESGATARTSLGLTIGAGGQVQAYDADLDTWAGVTSSANGRSLVSAANYAAMRALLDLEPGVDYNIYDADLTSFASVSPSANGLSLVSAANYAAMKTLLALTIGTNVQAWDADLDTLAAPTAWRMYYSNATSVQTAFALGAANTVLVSAGASSAPSFTAITAAMIPNAVADGATKGVATFTAADFDASSGVISIDYTNGTAAATGAKGFLTSTDWNTFNGKASLTSPDFTTPDVNVATFTSLCQSGQTIGTNIIVSAGFSVDATGNVTALSVTVPKVSGTAGETFLYEKYLTSTAGAGWMGPYTTAAGMTSYHVHLPSGVPAAGKQLQILADLGSNYYSSQWADAFSTAGGTLTGRLVTATPTTGTTPMFNLPSSAAQTPGTVVEGDLYYNGTNLYFRTSAANVDLLAASAPTLNSLGNPGAVKDFTMGIYTLGFTSTSTTWGGVTMTNSAASPAGGQLLTLAYAADDSANTMFLKCVDNSSTDVKFSIGQSGRVFIGDTANVQQTIGITINQGASDDEILALKSSDVAHPVTSLAEADTFGNFVKTSGTAGGLQITGFTDVTLDGALKLIGTDGAADPTDSHAALLLIGNKSGGTDGVAALGAAETVFRLDNHTTPLITVLGNAATAFAGTVSVATNLNPDTDGGASLGTTNTLEWQNLFLNTGAVINFENGDVLITHSANTLAFTGGTSYTFDAAVTAASFISTRTDANQYLQLYEKTSATGDEAFTLSAPDDVTPSSYKWTVPDAQAGASSFLTVSAAGALSYTAVSTMASLTAPVFVTSAEAPFLIIGSAATAADAGGIRLPNASYIMAEADGAGTDISVIGVDSAEIVQIGASGSSGVTITPALTCSSTIGAGAVTSSGTITSSGTFDATGATAIVIGSADITSLSLSGISETLIFTPSADMWTLSSGTGAAMTITPALTVTGTLTANGALAANGAITLGDGGDNVETHQDSTPANDHEWSGITVDGTAGEILAIGDLVCITDTSGAGAAGGATWHKADADVAPAHDAIGAVGQLGIAVSVAASANSAVKVMVRGVIRHDAYTLTNGGKQCYVGNTAGAIVTTAPSTAAMYVQVCGYSLSDDILLFEPSPDYILLK